MSKKQGWSSDLAFGTVGIALGLFVSMLPTTVPYQPIPLKEGMLSLMIAIFIFVVSHWIDSFWRQIGNVAAGLFVGYVVATMIMNHL